MAEITKVTTPMLPKENIGSKHKPVTDQAFELSDPAKVHKTTQDGKAAERQQENAANLLRDSMGRAAIAPLIKNAGEMAQIFKKIAFLIEMGVSASDVANDESTRALLESLFVSKADFPKILMEQDSSSVLFKGEAFNALREILDKFQDNPKIRDAIANLLKTFDQNVNTQNSVKTVLHNCVNLLDYMFSKDRQQFSNYLRGLAEMLLPQKEAQEFEQQRLPAPDAQGQTENAKQTANPQQTAQNLPEGGERAEAQGKDQVYDKSAAQSQGAQGKEQVNDKSMAQNQVAQGKDQVYDKNAPQTHGAPEREQGQAGAYRTTDGSQAPAQNRQDAAQLPPATPKEMAQVLKNNLLPLLGEIVVKYYQNEHIRDVVMVVVHNIVRVDQGTPEALKEAVSKLVNELKQVANLPQNFERNLLEAVMLNVQQAKNTPNSVISKLSDIIEKALTSPNANPAIVKQAGSMMISMLQNQSSMMDVLHFILPLQTPQGQVFTELYVDPETEERVGKRQGKSRKVFISVESEAHGQFELSFLETGGHVDFAMWCPEELVASLSGLKRHMSNIMQTYGYTMDSCLIEQMREPHSVAEVFPRLLEKKVGVDVRI